MNAIIPKKFYKAGNHPTARTVGELKEILEELPDDLRVEAGFGDMAQVVVYNHGQYDMHMEVIGYEEDEY